MNQRFLVVVGNKFKQFAEGKDAITVSQLQGILALPAAVMMAPQRLALIPGQGLSDADMADILAHAENSPHRTNFDLHLFRQSASRAPGQLTHKRRADNTLISEPRRLSDGRFEMDLLVAETCELMGDHQTGQHLQGMLLLEAARQSFLAVSEAFLLPQDGDEYYFIIDELSARYLRFVFPVAARLTYTVHSYEDAGGRHRSSFEASIEQGGRIAAVISGAFTAVKAARVNRMEQSLAREALAAQLAEAGEKLAGREAA